jgi:hypothetical protein
LAANAVLRSEAEGALPGVDHAKKAVADHIRDLYSGLGEPKSHPTPPFSRSVTDAALMPSSWSAADAPSKALWTRVVSPYCMECHRLNSLDWSNFGSFAFLRHGSLLEAYLGLTAQGSGGVPLMPQSELLFKGLQYDTAALSAVSAWASAN